MSERVKSVILVGPGKLAVKDISVPNVTPPAHRVRMMACGICGSDVRYLAGENPWSMHTVGKNLDSPPNMVLGHEIAGIVEANGVSKRVAILAYRACGRCRACLSGRENLCASVEHLGHGAGWGVREYYPGGMAEEFEVWDGFSYEIPDTISFEEATFLDGLAVAIHACDRARVVQGSGVAVLGLGPIGMLAAQVARERGAEHVMACDTTALPVELARGLGFESAAQSDGHAMFRRAERESKQFDAVIDTVGAQDTVEAAFALLAPGGVISLLAVHEGQIELNAMRLSAERYVTTSANSPYPDFQRAIDLLSSGRVSVAPLITHRFPLSDAGRAFEVMTHKDEHRAYKVVIVP